jgi:hypothetical protein
MDDGERSPIIVEDEALQDGFTQIPNAILRHPKITPGAKVAYGVLLSYAWQDDRCFPGQERMAHDMACGERSVRTYLQQLEDAALVSVKQRGLGKTNLYIIHRIRPAIFADQERQEPTPLHRQDLPTNNTHEKKTQ